MAVINGTEAGEQISGTRGDDEINGLGGDDVIFATDPNYVDPATGEPDRGIGRSETLNGGAGDDTLYMLAAGGVVDGGEGRDLVYFDFDGLTTPVRFDGAAGQLSGAATATLRNVERAFIFGGEGADVLAGGGDDDTFLGAGGADQLSGRGGNDGLDGGDGDDVLDGGAGADTVVGADGGDRMAGGSGADFLFAGEGDDIVDGGSGDDRMDGDEGDDVLISGEFAGVDLIDGGDGVDTVFISRAFTSRGLTIDLTNPTAAQVLADGTRLINVERLDVIGGFGRDSFTGGALNDILVGGGGNDTLNGGGGNDVLSGLFGDDRIDGGAGTDVAVFVGRRGDYRITQRPDGSWEVDGLRRSAEWDGTDIVSNVEILRFADGDWPLG